MKTKKALEGQINVMKKRIVSLKAYIQEERQKLADSTREGTGTL